MRTGTPGGGTSPIAVVVAPRLQCDGEQLARHAAVAIGRYLFGMNYKDQEYEVRGDLDECQAYAREAGRPVWARVIHPSGDEQTLKVVPGPRDQTTKREPI